jgi:hypothetical protein
MSAVRNDPLKDGSVNRKQLQRSGLAEVTCSVRSTPPACLETSVQRMVTFIDVMKRVRMPVDRKAAPFRSEAFTRLFTILSNVYFPPLSLFQAELVARLVIVSLPSR